MLTKEKCPMSILLIANIGRSDLQVRRTPTPDWLPDAPQDWKALSERDRGAYLAQHFDKLYTELDLAIIGKAVDDIDSSAIDRIVLFASDQHSAEYRPSDTIETARVAARMVQRRWGIDASRIEVVALNEDPSDHDAMIEAQTRELRRIAATYLPATAYLEVTGGTPAMTNALLLAGTEVFQDRAVALYISRDSAMPARLAVGKRLLAGPLRRVLLSNLATFQYTAALETWKEYRPYFTDQHSAGAADLVAGLLGHLDARINLDLPAARVAIKGLDALAGGIYRPEIEPLYNAITPLSREKQLGELLHVAEVRHQTEAYGELLTQVVRFVENCLRLVCLRQGVQFLNWASQIDDNGGKATVYQGREGKTGQKELQKLLVQIAAADPDVQAVLGAAQQCEKLIHLRNEITHSLSGVSEQMVTTAFGRPLDQLMPLLDGLYAQLTGQARAANPYLAVNRLLTSLLEKH
jgi:hypothetical protein